MKHKVYRRFTAAYLGSCSHFLGNRIERLRPGYLSLNKHLWRRASNDQGCSQPINLMESPLPICHPLFEENGNIHIGRGLDGTHTVAEEMGSIWYFGTRTSSEICTSTSMLRKSQEDPFSENWMAVKGFVLYYTPTLGSGLLFPHCDYRKIKAW